jgi:hypothetical protein
MIVRTLIATTAALWLAAGPASAQTPTDPAEAPNLAEAETADADQDCKCPCPEASKKKAKRKVVYVGPRQNIPVEVDRD